MANRVSARNAYRWQVLTPDGAAARASNGMSLQPTAPLGGARSLDIVFVCGGLRRASIHRARRAVRAAPPGARAGAARRTLHRQLRARRSGTAVGLSLRDPLGKPGAIREEFPEIQFLDDLYAIDRDRITCTGGVAPLDLMLTLIRARLGDVIADRIATQFIVERGRRASERQPLSPASPRVPRTSDSRPPCD